MTGHARVLWTLMAMIGNEDDHDNHDDGGDDDDDDIDDDPFLLQFIMEL